MDYTKTKEYAPYGSEASDWQKKAVALFENKDYKGGIKALEEGLKYDKFNIDLMMAESWAYRQLGNTAKSDEVRKRWFAIADSIILRGNGRSYETAWTVISVPEEYAVLRLLGCKSQRQFLEEHNGHMFDVLEALPKGAKEPISFYFNIDAPMKNLHHSLSGVDGTKAAMPAQSDDSATPSPSSPPPAKPAKKPTSKP